MSNTRKKIGLDARFYGPLGKGLGRYTKEVVDRVIRDRENDYVVFLCRENFVELDVSNFSNVKKVLVKSRWYSLGEQLELPYLIWREKITLMHFMHFNVPILTPSKFVVTIHDLILTKFPTIRATTLSPLIYKIKNLMYRLVIWSAIKRSESVIAVSKFTKHDIEEQFSVKADKVKMIYEGVTSDIKKGDNLTENSDDKKIILGYNIHRPYLLYVGNAYPHKNLEGLIDVFAKLAEKKPELSLALVSKMDYFYTRVKEYAQKFSCREKIIFPGYVPDADLGALYRQAEAYVFASLYEGFGLPPLEAMAQNCPVISSDKACMPEILQDAAVFFDPEKPVEMAEIILQTIDNADSKADLIRRGQALIKKYSWEQCAQEILKVYNEFK